MMIKKNKNIISNIFQLNKENIILFENSGAINIYKRFVRSPKNGSDITKALVSLTKNKDSNSSAAIPYNNNKHNALDKTKVWDPRTTTEHTILKLKTNTSMIPNVILHSFYNYSVDI